MFFNFNRFAILEKLPVLDLALLGVIGFIIIVSKEHDHECLMDTSAHSLLLTQWHGVSKDKEHSQSQLE